MVLAYALTAALLGAAPRPLPDADSGIHVPRLDKMGGVLAFMGKAGERSILLRPSTWFSDFHPLLYVDFTRPQSLKDAGIDATKSATVSFRPDGRMTCVTLADRAGFEERAKARLRTLGTLWEGKLGGRKVTAAKTSGGAFIAGYVLRKEVSCAVLSSKDAKALLEDAVGAVRRAKLQGAWRLVDDLKGEVFVVSADAAAGLSGESKALTVDALSSGLPVAPLERGGTSPYAALPAAGIAVVRAGVKPAALPESVARLTRMVTRLCKACDAKEVAKVAHAVSAQLTGKMAVAVDTVDVTGRLVTDAQRFAAAKQVWLGEVKDPKKAEAALAQVEAWKNAKAVEGGFEVATDAGPLRVGVHGTHLYLANDARALKNALAALPKEGGPQAHALTFALNPKNTSAALARISLFDVLGSKEVAGLFALSTELGPLLTATATVEGHADPVGKGLHRVGLVWTLR